MKNAKGFGLAVLLFLSAVIVSGQNSRNVLAQGEPPLTEEMVNRLDTVSMEHEIRRGDMMIVNRNQPAKAGDAVVVLVNGDYAVKDYQPRRNGLKLIPKNNKYKSQTITPKDDFEIFGVVTGILRNFKKLIFLH